MSLSCSHSMAPNCTHDQGQAFRQNLGPSQSSPISGHSLTCYAQFSTDGGLILPTSAGTFRPQNVAQLPLSSRMPPSLLLSHLLVMPYSSFRTQIKCHHLCKAVFNSTSYFSCSVILLSSARTNLVVLLAYHKAG